MRIVNFVHKGLERFATTGDVSGIQPNHTTKLQFILDSLSRAINVRDLQDASLHSLAKGRPAFKGWYGLRVNGNWRLTFWYDSMKNVVKDVDYVDYH